MNALPRLPQKASFVLTAIAVQLSVTKESFPDTMGHISSAFLVSTINDVLNVTVENDAQ